MTSMRMRSTTSSMCQVRAVEEDGVAGWDHGSDVASGVSLIAYELSLENILERHLFATAEQFPMAAAGPFLGIGAEKELAPGIGKDDRALIAALTHHVAVPGDRLLPFLEPGPSDGTRSHRHEAAVISVPRI